MQDPAENQQTEHGNEYYDECERIQRGAQTNKQ